MAKNSKRWIQGAIKHEGSLTRWAKQHGFVTEKGTINLKEAESYARKKGDTHRLRQINLARNLKKFKK